MMNLKPDRLNGQEIYRPVSTAGGTNHVNDGIVFPPKITLGQVPVLPADELVGHAVKNLVTISERTEDPVIKAQAVMFRNKIVEHQKYWLARAAENERARIKALLLQNGFKQAAEVL
jgi:hypothetical protein